ncbi:hypothetical protein ACJ5M8_004404 [Vibrio antiquarius]
MSDNENDAYLSSLYKLSDKYQYEFVTTVLKEFDKEGKNHLTSVSFILFLEILSKNRKTLNEEKTIVKVLLLTQKKELTLSLSL